MPYVWKILDYNHRVIYIEVMIILLLYLSSLTPYNCVVKNFYFDCYYKTVKVVCLFSYFDYNFQVLFQFIYFSAKFRFETNCDLCKSLALIMICLLLNMHLCCNRVR